MKIGFIGAGKVGFSLGKYFTEKGINLSGYYSREPASSKDAAEFTSSSHYLVVSELIRDSDVIFLTVPDAEISRVYNEIKTMNIIGKQLCHCSGAMTVADAFPDISAYSAQGFSIHPLFPVSSRYESYKQLDDAFFVSRVIIRALRTGLRFSPVSATEQESFLPKTKSNIMLPVQCPAILSADLFQ